MQIERYGNIRKNSYGTYKLNKTNTTSDEVDKSNPQHELMADAANEIPKTLLKKKTMALMGEIKRTDKNHLENLGKPSIYTTDKIYHNTDTANHDKLLSKEKVLNKQQRLIYKLYTPEQSTPPPNQTWNKTTHIVDKTKAQGSHINPNETSLIINAINYIKGHNRGQHGIGKNFKLFIFSVIVVSVLSIIISAIVR